MPQALLNFAILKSSQNIDLINPESHTAWRLVGLPNQVTFTSLPPLSQHLPA